MAADTLVTGGDTRLGFKSKIVKVGNLLVSATGTNYLHTGFVSWVKGGCKGDCPPMAVKSVAEDVMCTATGIIIMPDGRCVTFIDIGAQWVSGPHFTFGSGQDYARGALAMGATAEEAVRVAMEFDVSTGGIIESIRHH